MSAAREEFRKLGVRVPEIYLPSKNIDHQAWAVVACDQYSSEREYWENVGRAVGGKPSTLRLIYPECYLEDADKNERIASIQATMNEYGSKGYLESAGEGFILVERSTPYEKKAADRPRTLGGSREISVWKGFQEPDTADGRHDRGTAAPSHGDTAGRFARIAPYHGAHGRSFSPCDRASL